MLHVLTHNILPVFAMLALGFVLARNGITKLEEARAINRTAFLVLQPPLLFLLFTDLDLSQFRFDAMGLYISAQVIAFLATFTICRTIFRAANDEAFLLSMCVVFINTLLYIWPISTLIYSEAGAMPITAIVAFDSSASFAFFIIGMELISGKGSVASALPRIVKNPILITIVLSLAINFFAIPIPEPVMTAARFAGAAAAPMTLFALGAVLSQHPLTPTLPVVAVAGFKLLAFPVMVWALFQTFSPGNPWADLFNLAAAGPSGAMAFSLALLYGVRTDRIAPIIIWTSLISLLSLAYLA